MNIFLIMLISVFMAAYYMFFAPSARVPEQETVHAVAVSDLRSIAECALAVHNAQISGATFNASASEAIASTATVNKVTITNTIMNNLGVKKKLAQTIIDSIP